MFMLALALAVLVGISLGLLGGGGSILAVPILRYVLGMPTHQAIALSLLIVGTTSIAALIPHALRGHVRFRTGIFFGLAAMLGAFFAGRVAYLIPELVLLLGFALMMVATSVAMLRTPSQPKAKPDGTPSRELPVVLVLVEGVVVGAITGFVGAGGGFLVVPALVLLGGLPMELAVGTSLVVITMKSFAGFAGFAGTVEIDWATGLAISLAAVIGSVAGSMLARRVRPTALRVAFGWFVLAMAMFIVGQELPPLFGRTPSPALAAGIALLATALLAGGRALFVRRRSRHGPEDPPAARSPELSIPTSQPAAGGR